MKKSLVKTLLVLSVMVLPLAAYAAPEAVSDLTALTGSSVGEVDLTWTVPDPLDTTSYPTDYAVRYATSAITGANFGDPWVTTFGHFWGGVFAAKGTQQALAVTGLFPGTTYYFAVKAADNGLNYASWDIGAGVNTADSAVTLPSTVTGLTLSYSTSTINISWTLLQTPPFTVTGWNTQLIPIHSVSSR